MLILARSWTKDNKGAFNVMSMFCPILPYAISIISILILPVFVRSAFLLDDSVVDFFLRYNRSGKVVPVQRALILLFSHDFPVFTTTYPSIISESIISISHHNHYWPLYKPWQTLLTIIINLSWSIRFEVSLPHSLARHLLNYVNLLCARCTFLKFPPTKTFIKTSKAFKNNKTPTHRKSYKSC